MKKTFFIMLTYLKISIAYTFIVAIISLTLFFLSLAMVLHSGMFDPENFKALAKLSLGILLLFPMVHVTLVNLNKFLDALYLKVWYKVPFWDAMTHMLFFATDIYFDDLISTSERSERGEKEKVYSSFLGYVLSKDQLTWLQIFKKRLMNKYAIIISVILTCGILYKL